MSNLLLMARFNAWANDLIFKSVSELSETDYRSDRGAFFGSVHHTLNHLLLVDILWRAHLEGWHAENIKSLDQILYEDFEELCKARIAEDEALIRYCEALKPDAEAQEVTFKAMSGLGEPETIRRDHILITLFNHQTHHRGQIHCLLTQSSIFPAPLDVYDFLME